MTHTFPNAKATPRYETKAPYYRKFKVAWRNMMARCYEPNAKRYENYGGRGIRVCERWHEYKTFYQDMFPSFLIHANAHAGDTQLDRLSNADHYFPDNCQWATRLENIRKRGSAHKADGPLLEEKTQIRNTPEQKRLWQVAAAAKKQVLADWMRDQLMEAATKDLQSLNPSSS